MKAYKKAALVLVCVPIVPYHTQQKPLLRSSSHPSLRQPISNSFPGLMLGSEEA